MQIGSTAEPVFFIPKYRGYGVLPVTGDGGISVVRDLIGTGNISTLSGAAESFTYNPADITTLFDIAGIGTYRTVKSEVKRIETLISGAADPVFFIPHWRGQGVIPVTGDGYINIVRDITGSGSISTLSGAAESFTVNPPDQTTLFDIAGRSVNRITKDYSVDAGLVTISGSAAESFVRASYPGTGYITTADEAKERTTVIEEGSGNISTFSGAAECVAFSPDEENMLFSYNGRGHVLRTRSYHGQIEVLISGVAITNPPFGVHTGKGDIFVKGASGIEFVYAAPSRTYGWIV